jgi:hypothetical protein
MIDCRFTPPASWPKYKRQAAIAKGWQTSKNDADNLAKSILDGATGIVWDDDSQVVGLVVTKRYDADAKTLVTVIEPDKNLRSFKCGELTILNCSEDLDLGEFLDNGAAVIDAMPYFWAKGDKGDPFTYDDFTAEQIAELQRPATDAVTELTQEVHALEQQFTEQENQRIANESQREGNESERHQLFSVDHQRAVSDHTKYEQDHTKELQRQLNESQRQQAETTREQAEASRNTNESNRQQAETQREETFATYRPIIDAKLDMISQEQFNQIFE